MVKLQALDSQNVRKPSAMRRTFVLKNSEGAADFAVNKWHELSVASVAEQGYFSVALSGGKTPLAFYQKLATSRHPLSWDKTHIFFADERFVPYTDKASNYRLINGHLLSRIAIPRENIHPVPVNGLTLEQSAKRYEFAIRAFFNISDDRLPLFELVMLGIGEDGHTASLFPGTLSLRETKRLATPVIIDRFPAERISITLPVINSAKNVIFLVTGKRKAAALKAILEENVGSMPAAQVRPLRGTVLFILDEDAASLLSARKGCDLPLRR
jgi:6-phosphogluconolactonase